MPCRLLARMSPSFFLLSFLFLSAAPLSRSARAMEDVPPTLLQDSLAHFDSLTRALRWRAPWRPSLQLVSAAELGRYAVTRARRERARVQRQREAELLQLLGAFDAPSDYFESYAQLFSRAAGGAYDPEARRILIRADLVPEARAEVIHHELFHAAQDAAWGLTERLQSEALSYDERLALIAFFEADATLSAGWRPGHAWTLPAASEIDAIGLQIATGGAAALAGRVPPYLQRLFIASYQEGLHLFARWRRQGMSWRAIRARYQSPPRSSATLLSPSLESSFTPPPRWPLELSIAESLWSSSLGRLHWRALLSEGEGHLTAAALTRGWRGDEARLLRGTAGRYACVSARWESPLAARNFGDALRRHGQRSGRPLTLNLRDTALALCVGPASEERALLTSALLTQTPPTDLE